MESSASQSTDIDDSLYSRQRCVLGENAMQLLSKSRVFVCGLSAVGVEIAKNLILAGVGEVVIQDCSVCTHADLGTQFFIREADVKAQKTRAEAALPRLAALNPYVKVTLDTNDLNTINIPLGDSDQQHLLHPLLGSNGAVGTGKINCLVLTEGSLRVATILDFFCRSNGIHFIYTEVIGVLGHVFCDFGPEFHITDPVGEPAKEFFIGSIEKHSPTELVVHVFGDRRHQLDDGDVVQLCELRGMGELNNQQFTVRVVSPTEFAIQTNTTSLSSYESGGIARQLIQPKTQSFKTLMEQLRHPSIVTTELSHPDEGAVLHLVFLTLKKFLNDEQRLPAPSDENDWALFHEKFLSLSSLMPDMHPQVDIPTVRRLASASRGQLAPLCAFFGGVASQEVMKSITGCFTPFNQWLFMQCESVVPREMSYISADNKRYTPLEICIGPDCLERLRQLNVFMVGCGAIGCELLKNLALLGVATSEGLAHPTPSVPVPCTAVDQPNDQTSNGGSTADATTGQSGLSDATATAAPMYSSTTGAGDGFRDPDSHRPESTKHANPQPNDSDRHHRNNNSTQSVVSQITDQVTTDAVSTPAPSDQGVTQTGSQSGSPSTAAQPDVPTLLTDQKQTTLTAQQPVASTLITSASLTRPGRILITDPDHIEKSNLNRQFLFHSEHIGLSKSAVAAQAVRELNPDVRIEALGEKFSPETAKTIFTDSMLQLWLDCPTEEQPDRAARGVVLAALDCVESRRYTDTRCVSLRVPLFESGTLGTKGHVQVILPGQTESYNSQPDGDGGVVAADGAQAIPYCTLKSFPSLPVHCIEWAREKFASAFTLKPSRLSHLLADLGRTESYSPPQLLLSTVNHLLGRASSSSLEQPSIVDAKATWLRAQLTPSLCRFIASRPVDWVSCVQVGRDKFERYFDHKARQLLHSFPPDVKLADGSPFWKLPRRQPTPISFDSSNPLHQQFVLSYARLLATQLNIPIPECCSSLVTPSNSSASADDLQGRETHLEACLIGHCPPEFLPSGKRIVTDENEPSVDKSKNNIPNSAPAQTGGNGDGNKFDLDEHLLNGLQLVESAIQDPRRCKALYSCSAIAFEKDDDQLPHVDFITAAANLRATMYGLPVTPRHEVRRIAGRIVPAIATTTAAVAGLVCVELLKYVAVGTAAHEARNAFLNLALPVILLSEPAPCPRTRLPNGREFTLWDRFVLPAPKDWNSYRLSDLLHDIKQYHALKACVINQGNRMVYVDYLPFHASRLDKLLKTLLVLQPEDHYVDLMVAYSPNSDLPSTTSVAAAAGRTTGDYIQGPPVRLMLS